MSEAVAAKKNLRVGVRVTGGKQWIAGFHYLKNLFTALDNANTALDLVLYAAHETDPAELHLFSDFAKEIVEYNEFDNAKVARFLKAQNLDCVFAAADYGKDLGIPQLSWLFDFQHKDMPELFPERDLRIREEMFARVLEQAQIVILSSNDALQACQKFYPDYVEKARVMSFVAHIPEKAYATDPFTTALKYSLPPRFIYLPNQFWKHKNHDVVIEAVNKAVKNEPSLLVVFSGAMEDTRNQFHGPYLRSKVLMYNLQANIRMLGLIPEDDVFALMRISLAILQPSLYEGWSTVVEQAKALGKPIIISDLPVHREQNPDKAEYFEPHDSDELATILLTAWHNWQPGPDMASEQVAEATIKERSVLLGRRFSQLVGEAVELFAHHETAAPAVPQCK